MLKKYFMLLVTLTLLGGTLSNIYVSAESSQETSSQETDNNDNVMDQLDSLIEEENFTNQTGYQAWVDFKELSESYSLLNLLDFDEDQGSSESEIEAFFADKDVQIVKNDLGEGESQMYIRYIDPDGEMLTEDQPVFYGEILVQFLNDKLVYASVQPGFFEVPYDYAIPWTELSQASHLSQYQDLSTKPYIMTVSQVNLDGQLVTIPAVFTRFEGEGEEDEGSDQPIMTLVYPLFAMDEQGLDAQIIDMGAHYFEEVSQDFGNWAFIVIRDMVFNNNAEDDDQLQEELIEDMNEENSQEETSQGNTESQEASEETQDSQE